MMLSGSYIVHKSPGEGHIILNKTARLISNVNLRQDSSPPPPKKTTLAHPFLPYSFSLMAPQFGGERKEQAKKCQNDKRLGARRQK